MPEKLKGIKIYADIANVCARCNKRDFRLSKTYKGMVVCNKCGTGRRYYLE